LIRPETPTLAAVAMMRSVLASSQRRRAADVRPAARRGDRLDTLCSLSEAGHRHDRPYRHRSRGRRPVRRFVLDPDGNNIEAVSRGG